MRITADRYMASLGLPEVYRVGGSVRDELLGRESKDTDYMVRGASLPRIKDALDTTGAKVSVLKLRDGQHVGWRAHVRGLGLLEIVLPRTEISTGPGHRDFRIVVDEWLPLEEDAQRRDFTINAVYRNVQNGDLLDPLGGIEDIEDRIIATTHPDSFRDDPLRILRALRFKSKLGFALAAATREQMEAHADAVTGLSAKGYASGTVLNELSGLLMGSRPGDALRDMRDTGVMAVLLPELTPMLGFEQGSRYHDKTADEHTFDAVQAAANMHYQAPLPVRWALLFHDAGKPEVAWIGEDSRKHYYAFKGWLRGHGGELDTWINNEDHEVASARIANAVLSRLNAPTKLRRQVVTLVERHMLPLHSNIKPFKVRKWRAELGDDMLHMLIVHRVADVLGKGGDVAESIDTLRWIADEQARAKANNVPVSVRDLEISGHDLKAMGFEGAAMGSTLQTLLHEVLAQPKLNDREWLLNRAEALK